MAGTSKFIAIFIIIISFIIGLLSFYLMSDLTKEQKKRQMDEILSQLMNLVIFIWIGKILLNLSTFLEDPMAILAYPSDSSVFYLSVLLIGCLLFCKSKRKGMDVVTFIHSFIHVFLAALFVFEFIQLVWNDNTISFGNMALSGALLIIFLSVQRRFSISILITIMLTGWSFSVFILAMIGPYVTVFGYILEPWFIVVFFVVNLIIIFIYRRK